MEVAKDSRVVFLQQKPALQQKPESGELLETLEQSSISQSATDDEPKVLLLPLGEVVPSPYQTRQFDDSESLGELVQSIHSHGVLQPVLVRRRTEGGYELVAGERRFRAAQLAGLSRVPAIVSDLSDRDAVEISIIENAQRENLNPIEEAKAFLILSKHFSLAQNEIAQSIGKSRAAVANSLRLLQLDPEVQELIISGQLTGGHGKGSLDVREPPASTTARETCRANVDVGALLRRARRQTKRKARSKAEQAPYRPPRRQRRRKAAVAPRYREGERPRIRGWSAQRDAPLR